MLALVLGGCGGGGGGGGSSSGGPASVPATAAVATPPGSAPVSSASNLVFAIPSTGARIGTLAWTNVAATGNVLVNTTYSTAPPAGTPALQSARRGVRDVGASALAYLSVVPTASFTIANLPAITVSLAGVSAPLGVAFFDPAAGTYVAVGSAMPSAGTASFAPPSPARAQNFVLGTSYVFAFYAMPQQIGISVAIPTPAPSAPPSPAASTSPAPSSPAPSSPAPSSTASATPAAPPSVTPAPVPSVTPAPLPASCPATNPAGVTFTPGVVAIGSVGGQVTVTAGGMTAPLTALVSAPSLATATVTGLAVTVSGLNVGSTYLQITDAHAVTACAPVTITQLVITGS